MSKRGADRQLTRDDGDEESYEEAGTYERASAEDLKTRRIVKPRKKGNTQSSSTSSDAAPSSGFNFGTTTTSPPFSFTTDPAANTTKEAPFSFKTDTATGGFQFTPVGNKDSDRITALEAEVKMLKERLSKLEGNQGVEKVNTSVTNTTAAPEESKPASNGFNFSATSSEPTKPAGGFSFDLKSNTASTSYPIPSFNFGGSYNSFGDAAKSGTSFLDSSQSESQLDSQQDSQAGGEDDLEAPPSSANDAPPSLTLADEAQVSHATGEEGENTVCSSKVKLFELEKDEKGASGWKERGIGLLKLNHKKENGKSRLIMRKENVGTLLVNSYIFPDMKCEKPQEKGMSISAFVDGSVKHYLFKFMKAEQCDEFKNAVEDAKKK